MRKLILIIMLFLQFSAMTHIQAKQETDKKDISVYVEIDIYRLGKMVDGSPDLTTLLKNAILEDSPKLVVEPAKEAKILISDKITVNKGVISTVDSVQLSFITDKDAKTFDLEVKLMNKKEESISTIKGSAINSILIFSTLFKDEKKLVRVRTTRFNSAEEEKPTLNKH